MYQKIAQQKHVLDKYSEQLLSEGVVTKDDIQKFHDATSKIYNKGLEDSKSYKAKPNDWLESVWAGFKSPAQQARIQHTGVKIDTLKHVGKTLSTIPEGFTAHSIIKRLLAEKAAMFQTGKGIDWATAEALAFGTASPFWSHLPSAGMKTGAVKDVNF
jgi:2-oxoglutarate dehydrogenase E1 component